MSGISHVFASWPPRHGADVCERSSSLPAHQKGPLLNRVLEHGLLPVGEAVLRTEIMRELRRWRRLQALDAESISRIQRDALTRLLTHAATTVPHYRDLGVHPHEDPDEWLRRFPVLIKADLRSDGKRLLTPGVRGLVKVSSSGSSGVQSTLWCTRREISRSQAIQTLWWEWSGYRLGDPDATTPDRATTALCQAVGEVLEVTWQRVDHIPDSPSGKPQIIRPPAS